MDSESSTVEKRVSRDKESLLKFLLSTGDLKIACRKAGVGRSSYYRYRKYDAVFAKKADDAAVNGMLHMRDIADKLKAETEDQDPYKEEKYTEFIEWYAKSPYEKEQFGITDQKQFAEYNELSKDTLTRWKKRHDFSDRVESLQLEWRKEKTQLVISGILKSAVQGNPTSQKLWLTYLSGYNLDELKKGTPKKNSVPIDDIRFIIDSFPDEAMRSKYYHFLHEVLYEGSVLKDKYAEKDLEANIERRRKI